MNISIIGIGNMGKEVIKIAPKHGDVIYSTFSAYDVITKEATRGADVMIDFTNGKAFLSNIDAMLETGKPIVVGTTGWHDKKNEIKKKVEEYGGALLYAANFSLGVQIFFRMARYIGKLIEPFPDFDIAVSETHHTKKLDYPSGTALEVAHNILKSVSRKKDYSSSLEIGKVVDSSKLMISSLRMGGIFGKHSIHVDSKSDEITLTHSAKNRSAFASGALMASKWLVGKQGFFSIDDYLHDILIN